MSNPFYTFAIIHLYSLLGNISTYDAIKLFSVYKGVILMTLNL